MTDCSSGLKGSAFPGECRHTKDIWAFHIAKYQTTAENELQHGYSLLFSILESP